MLLYMKCKEKANGITGVHVYIYIYRRIILKCSIKGTLFLWGIKQRKMGLGIFGGDELNKISREVNGITGVDSDAYQ
jgi:hypothetical protein